MKREQEDDHPLICDVCGEEIYESYYEMPDGLVICTESDCLEVWAHEYKQQVPIY